MYRGSTSRIFHQMTIQNFFIPSFYSLLPPYSGYVTSGKNNRLIQGSVFIYRSQQPSNPRRMSAAVSLLRSWVRIPPGGMDVCCDCCVLSVRGLCDELITRPEESYRLWCVVVFDLETSRMRGPWPSLGRSATGKKKVLI